MHFAFLVSFSALVLTLLGTGCRSVGNASSRHSLASEAEIRAKIVGTWRLVEPTNRAPVTITFRSDGDYECTSIAPGLSLQHATWQARGSFVQLIKTNYSRTPEYYYWSVWRVDDHELVMFTGGFSAAGPPDRFTRWED